MRSKKNVKKYYNDVLECLCDECQYYFDTFPIFDESSAKRDFYKTLVKVQIELEVIAHILKVKAPNIELIFDYYRTSDIEILHVEYQL